MQPVHEMISITADFVPQLCEAWLPSELKNGYSYIYHGEHV